MKTNRKTIPMPMRYLINTVLIVLFVLASTLFVTPARFRVISLRF